MTGALVFGLAATSTSFAQGQAATTTTLTPTATATTTTTTSSASQRALSTQALLLATTQTPQAVATSTPTPTLQPTATPTLAPTLSPTSSALSTTTTTTLVASAPAAAATPLVDTLVSAPFTSATSSPVAVSSAEPPASPQGLPPSAIFVPGGNASTAVAAPAVASTTLAGPFDQVIDATVGGTLALPDRSLQLTVPGGVANTDFVLVSLSEVGPSSASGNLQVGNRVFALNVVDSGGLTVTNFGTPILVTATATATATASAPRASGTGPRGIAALDPTSGQFNPIATDAPSGQLVGSLDRLAAPATTGVPDPALNIASTANSRSASAPQAQQRQPQSARGGAADPANVVAALGLAP